MPLFSLFENPRSQRYAIDRSSLSHYSIMRRHAQELLRKKAGLPVDANSGVSLTFPPVLPACHNAHTLVTYCRLRRYPGRHNRLTFSGLLPSRMSQ